MTDTEIFKTGDKVKVTKISATENPLYRTARNGEWKEGQHNPGIVPPVNYINEGIIYLPPQVGKKFNMYRTKRGDLEAAGYFATSEVTEIEEIDTGCIVYTENSVYKMELLERKDLE